MKEERRDKIYSSTGNAYSVLVWGPSMGMMWHRVNRSTRGVYQDLGPIEQRSEAGFIL